MFSQGHYDVLEFSVPAKGMNQNISPEILPKDFAYLLENLIPKPLGEARVRFGTSFVAGLPNPESTIMRMFPFIKSDGSAQIILYVQEYIQDHTASDFEFFEDDPYAFAFNTDHEANYAPETPIKVVYTLNGLQTVYDSIEGAENIQGDSTFKVTLLNNSFPPLLAIEEVWFSSGTIYVYDLKTNTLSPPLKQNLSVACLPRGVTFLNNLVLSNGVDRILRYDGRALSEVYDLVKDGVLNLTRDDDITLSFTAPANFNEAHYEAGKRVKVTVRGVSFQTTIVQLTDQGGGDYTLEVEDVLPQFVQGQTFLFYQAFPPPFNFLYVAYDRLWALGPGAVSTQYREADVSMRVYFMHKSNSLTGWFDERTQEVPNINLSERHGTPDNLEAICLVNGYLAFMGREKTQVFTGSEPIGAIAAANREPLIYNTTLNTGVIHGDLLLELPNDAWFVSQNGLQSAGSLNIAKQFSATSFDALDPLLKTYQEELLKSNLHYRKALSFQYKAGSLAGFKIGSGDVLTSLLSTSLYSWSLFSGDFRKATSLLNLKESLYLSIQNKIYRYGDGNEANGLKSPPSYGDQGGSALIPFSWTLPVVSMKGRSFACRRCELQMEYPSSFTLHEENRLSLLINGDIPKSYQIEKPFRFDLRGDTLRTIPLTEENPPVAESIGFRFDQPFHTFKDRLKFLASRFWLTVSGYTRDGPLSFHQIKLYGIRER